MNKPIGHEIIKGKLQKFKFGVGLKPVKGMVTLFYCMNGTKINTDEDGKFSFRPIYEKGFSPDMFLSGVDIKGRSNVSLCIDQNLFDE